MKMLDQQQDMSLQSVARSKHSELMYAARLVSLGPCAFLGLVVFSAIARQSSNYMFEMVAPFLLLVIPAVIALKWHRIGGIAIILAASSILGYSAYQMNIHQGNLTKDIVVTYRLFSPFLSVICAVGGVLHLAYWYKAKRTSLVVNQRAGINKRRLPNWRETNIVQAAWIFSLGPGIYVAIGVISSLIFPLFDPNQAPFEIEGMFFVFLSLIPAIAACWWHRIGGVLLILSATGVIVAEHYWVPSNVAYMAIVLAFLIATGGMLHLLHWYKEKRPANA